LLIETAKQAYCNSVHWNPSHRGVAQILIQKEQEDEKRKRRRRAQI
jgi:hypothetical protein